MKLFYAIYRTGIRKNQILAFESVADRSAKIEESGKLKWSEIHQSYWADSAVEIEPIPATHPSVIHAKRLAAKQGWEISDLIDDENILRI